MRGQLQAPAALPTDKKPPVSTEEGAGCVPQPVCTLKTNSPASVGNQRFTRWTGLWPTSYSHSDYAEGLKIMNCGQDGSMMS